MRSKPSLLVTMPVFLVAMVAGVSIVGANAPYWQTMITAVIAGLIALAAGQAALRARK